MHKGKSPRHIFIIVGESYSAWPLLPAYESLGLAGGVKNLAENGLSFKEFLPSAGGTMASLIAIMVGLPDAGVYTNYQRTSRSVYPSSIAGIFKQLGYKTRFFYGGYLSWQRIGDFCRSQGFDEIYGGGHMGNWVSSNEWGVDDEFLFEFVLKTVSDDIPSLNIILTTSFHRPFDIDVRAKGFRYHHMGKDLLDPNQRSWGISRDQIIGSNFIADLQGSPKIYPLPGKKLPPHRPKFEQLKQLPMPSTELPGGESCGARKSRYGI